MVGELEGAGSVNVLRTIRGGSWGSEKYNNKGGYPNRRRDRSYNNNIRGAPIGAAAWAGAPIGKKKQLNKYRKKNL